MNKSKFVMAVITILISAVILYVIINIIFNKNSNINQGKLRVSDALLTSTVELEDKSENMTKWKFDITQSNKVSMLIQTNSDAKIKEVYIEKFKAGSNKNINIYIEQDKYDVNYKYENIKNKKVNIYAEETEEGNYLIEFDIRNEDVVSNYEIPEDIKEIRHDGTILSLAKIPLSQILFDVKYNLIVIEEEGQINKCKVKLEMPAETMISEGLSVTRLDATDFNFKIDY